MCESNPCTNGGTCTTMTSSYRCLCVEGFRGINCQGAFHNYSLKKKWIYDLYLPLNFQCWLTGKIFTDSIDRYFFYLKEWLVNWVVLSLTDRSMITIDWLIDSLYWRLVTHLINNKFLLTLVSYFPNWLLTQHWPYNRTRQMPLASMSKWRNLHPRDHWNVQMSMSWRIQRI